MDPVSRPIGRAVNPFLAALGLLAVMTASVVATMVAENWRHLVVPIPVRDVGSDRVEAPAADEVDTAPVDTTPLGTAPLETTPEPAAQTDTSTAPTDTSVDGPEQVPAVAHLAPSGSPEGAIEIDGATVRIRDQDTADVLAAVLFAGLASTRRSGADRAAAWVTASATPPTADPSRFPPGVRLRGRSAKVAELLEHGDGGCVWVTLQRDVDIARGLARTTVTQPTLAGLVEWWRATRDMPTVLTPAATGEVATAIEAIRHRLDTTAWSRVVGPLHDALGDAASADSALLVCLVGSDGDDAGSGVGSEVESARTPSPSAGAAVVSGDPRRAARTS